MAVRKRSEDATEARLAGLELPQAGWSRPAREEALARLRAAGLPHRRDEYWRFTDPAMLNAADVEPVADRRDDEGTVFDAIDRLEIVFVDGVFDAGASGALDAEEGLEIVRLAEADDADIHWARGLYGQIEARGQEPVARPLASLNTAFATDGLLIRATGRVRRTVSVVYRRREAGADPILHHCIRVEKGAEMTLLETGPGGARLSTGMEVEVEDGGRFHHVRSQGRMPARRAATAAFARVGAGASYKSFTLTANGALTRNEHVIELAGDGGIAHVAGAAIGDAVGAPFHHDDTVFVTHDALDCESRQVFKRY